MPRTELSQSCHPLFSGWGDGTTVSFSDKIFFETYDCNSQGGHYIRPRRKGCTGRHLGNTAHPRIGGTTEGIQLRHYLGADKFARQFTECQRSRFFVVHCVYGECPATVVIKLHGFIGQRHVPVNVTAVAG